MRGTLAKRIHSMQKSVTGLTWPKAVKMWNELMEIDHSGGEPKFEESRLERRRRLDKKHGIERKFQPRVMRISYNRSEGHPVPQIVSTVRSLSTCGGVRPGPYKKISDRYIRRAMRAQAEALRHQPAGAKSFLARLQEMFGVTKGKP